MNPQTELVDVAIVGAGPYGISIAAHLKAKGVGMRLFGPPMKTWLDMPASLNLKAFGFASNLSVPAKHCTFPEYCRARGLEDFEPCSMASFAQYGLWIQQRLVPEAESAMVTRVARAGGAFEIALATGEELRARRVVVTVGVVHFASKPAFLRGIPRELASHTADIDDYAVFKGKHVAVIGAGASAVEAAAMVHEAGGRGDLLVRGDPPYFNGRFNKNRSLIDRIKAPNTVLGPGRKSWVLQTFPSALHFVPEPKRVRFTRRYLGPAGPWWLAERFHGKVNVTTHCEVVGVEPEGGGLRVHLREEGKPSRSFKVDHLIAGTGYEPDVDRLEFLDPALRRDVRRVERAPALSRHFESSVPGLFFAGPVAAFDFGPLLRFVSGAEFAAPVVAARLARDAAPQLRFSIGGSLPPSSPVRERPVVVESATEPRAREATL
jgi:thioredoxin reductase